MDLMEKLGSTYGGVTMPLDWKLTFLGLAQLRFGRVVSFGSGQWLRSCGLVLSNHQRMELSASFGWLYGSVKRIQHLALEEPFRVVVVEFRGLPFLLFPFGKRLALLGCCIWIY